MSDPIRDSLDDAIDRVASSLVSVQEDPNASQRILSSLPPRRERRWWSARSLPVQAAAFASVVLVVAYLRSPVEDRRRVHDTSRATAVLEGRPVTNLVEPGRATVPDTAIAEPFDGFTAQRTASRRESAASRPYELTALTAPEQLSFPALQTATPLAAVEPASVAPIALAELPLATDEPSRLSKE